MAIYPIENKNDSPDIIYFKEIDKLDNSSILFKDKAYGVFLPICQINFLHLS